jgi:hypothetical protein
LVSKEKENKLLLQGQWEATPSILELLQLNS